MNHNNTISTKKETWFEYLFHYLGMIIITASFIYLSMYVVLGGEINVPPLFFALYALGGSIMAYEMRNQQVKYDISFLEIIGVVCALFLLLMKVKNKF